MANEATCIETPTRFARYTVADGNDLAVGTVLKLTDPNTAAATSASSDTFAGIVWVAKEANDGVTEVVAALNGVWDLTDAGAGFNAGAILSTGGANTVKVSTAAELLTGDVVGKSLETAGAAEVVRVRVGEVI